MTTKNSSSIKTRRIARDGDLQQIMDLGGLYQGSNRAWDIKSLDLIRQRWGEVGALAALNAQTPAQAAAAIMTAIDSDGDGYRCLDAFAVFVRPGMERVLEALFQCDPSWQDDAKMRHIDLWRTLCKQQTITQEAVRITQKAIGNPPSNAMEMLTAGVGPNEGPWNALMRGLGREYFHSSQGWTRLALGGETEATPLYNVLYFSNLIRKGRIDKLINFLEEDPESKLLLVEKKHLLGRASLLSGKRVLLKRIQSWGDGTWSTPVDECSLLEIGILSQKIQHTRWEDRWPCMKFLGAGNAKVFENALSKPKVIEGLLSCADEMESDHALAVLKSAASVGVNISGLRDDKGNPILQALMQRQRDHVAEVISLVENHALQEQTLRAAPINRPRRM